MRYDLKKSKKNSRWHVPCCIATLAMGIYLALVYMVPSFAQEYHEIIFHGGLYKIVPYAIVFLIGSPLFSLWFYTKIESDENFRDWYSN